MDRRKFAFTSVSACTTAAIGTQLLANDTSSDDAHSAPNPVPFKAGTPVKLDLQSAPVMWRDSPVHLLTLNHITFSLHQEGRSLIAKVNGSIQTFDNVEYDISVAVFGGKGDLLGSSRAVCKVPRHWAGRCGMQQTSLTLDFGISNDFPQARSFLACISNRDVLTPDQW